MEQQSIFSNLIYSFIACCFTASVAITVFLGTFGWLISGWDPFGWTDLENTIVIFVGPMIYYFSCLIAIFTLDVLVSKTKTKKIPALINANNFGSVFGIIGYFMIPIGIGIFLVYKTDSGEKAFMIPILALYIGIIVILGLLGLYLVWCNPTPKNATELEEWHEYASNTKIPILKWIYVWFIFYFVSLTIFSAIMATINKIIPNPIASYYFNNGALFDIQEALIFFPGPLLHTITFIIYYWQPMRIKLNLYLLKHRSGIDEGSRATIQPEDNPNDENKITETTTRDILQRLDEEFPQKHRWFRFTLVILLVQAFVVVSFSGIHPSTNWQIFIIIYSFWIWFFYLNMFIVSRLGVQLGFVGRNNNSAV